MLSTVHLQQIIITTFEKQSKFLQLYQKNVDSFDRMIRTCTYKRLKRWVLTFFYNMYGYNVRFYSIARVKLWKTEYHHEETKNSDIQLGKELACINIQLEPCPKVPISTGSTQK